MKPSPTKKYNVSDKSSEAKTPRNKKRKSPPKSGGEVNYKNQVKEMFSNWFKKNNRVGYVMSKQDVVRNILTKLCYLKNISHFFKAISIFTPPFFH